MLIGAPELRATTPALGDAIGKVGWTGFGVVSVLLVGVVTVMQRYRADRRDQWWKRAQWALDLTLLKDETSAALGFTVLTYLANSKLAQHDESTMLREAADGALARKGPPRPQSDLTVGPPPDDRRVPRSGPADDRPRTVVSADGVGRWLDAVKGSEPGEGSGVAAGASASASDVVDKGEQVPTRVQVQAANLREITDINLHMQTPDWVRDIAASGHGH